MYALLDEFLDLNTGINWVEMGDKRQKRQNNNIDTITESVWQQVETHKNTTYNKDHYVGIYEDNWFGKVEIFNNNGDLWFKSFKSPRLNGKLQF